MILELRFGRKIGPQLRLNPEFTLGADFEVLAPLNKMALKMETHYKWSRNFDTANKIDPKRDRVRNSRLGLRLKLRHYLRSCPKNGHWLRNISETSTQKHCAIQNPRSEQILEFRHRLKNVSQKRMRAKRRHEPRPNPKSRASNAEWNSDAKGIIIETKVGYKMNDSEISTLPTNRPWNAPESQCHAWSWIWNFDAS